MELDYCIGLKIHMKGKGKEKKKKEAFYFSVHQFIIHQHSTEKVVLVVLMLSLDHSHMVSKTWCLIS